MENKATGHSKLNDSLDKRSYNIVSELPSTCVNHLIIHFKKLTEVRESSFNMARGGGGNEDIETRSLKF